MATLTLDYPTLVLCVVFLLSCIFVFVRSVGKDGAVRGGAPPSPWALPIIGNLHQLGRGHHHRKLQALTRRHGPLFLLRLGSVPTIVVSSPSLADAVLRTQDHVFCSRTRPAARSTAAGTWPSPPTASAGASSAASPSCTSSAPSVSTPSAPSGKTRRGLRGTDPPRCQRPRGQRDRAHHQPHQHRRL
ncbi:hypothetical protein ACQ4PT_037654 [Festuca glaucescens]